MAELRPQVGPQERFLTASADLVIYGGSAGSGKSYGLLLDDLYHIANGQYDAVHFRRTYPQILNPGGLWDTATDIFPGIGGRPNLSRLEWRFPSGAVVKFAHLQHESDKLQWQGSSVCALKFDELDHFSEAQFFYLLSRNRSTSGIRPYVRATCNANADSWVADLVSWWIDPETGFPIPERAGAVRWMARDGGQLLWADRASDLPWVRVEIDGEMVPQPPKSVSFIPAKVTDNPALLSKDPGYLANLLALAPVDRARLLEGNWKIRAVAGTFFRREWFPIVDAVPAGARHVRYWDFAATKEAPGIDPDWTAGALLALCPDNTVVIRDIRRIRDTPGAVERLVKHTSTEDPPHTETCIEQEPGSAGKMVGAHYVRNVLAGQDAHTDRVSGSKKDRAKPLSAQSEAGNVSVLRGAWNAAFWEEAEGFPEGPHDDQIDAATGAYSRLTGKRTIPWA